MALVSYDDYFACERGDQTACAHIQAQHQSQERMDDLLAVLPSILITVALFMAAIVLVRKVYLARHRVSHWISLRLNTPLKRLCAVASLFIWALAAFRLTHDLDYGDDLRLTTLLILLAAIALPVIAFTRLSDWIKGGN